jgi:Eukaryotic and archaeal DNA primase, large subunit
VWSCSECTGSAERGSQWCAQADELNAASYVRTICRVSIFCTQLTDLQAHFAQHVRACVLAESLTIARHVSRRCRLAAQAADKAQQGHFQVACARVFEGVVGEAPDAGVTHPNSYLAEAMEITERRTAAAQQRGVASAAPPLSASPAPSAATPSLGSTATPGQPFMRTPMGTVGAATVTPASGLAGASALSPLMHSRGCMGSGAPTASSTPTIAQLADSPIQGVQNNARNHGTS